MARTSRDEAPRRGRRLIPEETIDRIKQQTDLAALVRSRGVDLKKHGSKDLIGLCPFHDDHDPSFVVTPGKGLYHCLGCGAAGNAIQFVEKYDGISFRHAFELLAEGGNVAFKTSPAGPIKQATVPKLENPFSPEASNAELMDQVVDYYHERLQKTPAVLDYLRTRGLNNLAAISRFRLGFADRSLGLRLPEKNRVAGKAIRGRLEQLGIYRESGHEHFNGSLVIPVLNASGEVVEMYGRKINDHLRKGTPLHLYLSGPHAGIWNGETLNEPEIILCEAPLDALTFWVSGIHNVTFIYGTEGFTDELFNELIKRKVQRVRLAYDNDGAGNRAATRDAERLSAQGIEVYRVRFPHGMDVNSFAVAALRQSRDSGKYARKVTPSEESLSQAVKSAEWIGVNGKKVATKKEHVPSSVISVPSVLKNGEYHTMQLGQRVYRVGGLEKNGSLDVIKITLRIQHNDLFHLDNLDLTQDVHRRRFIERAHEETRLEKELIKRDLGKLLFALEDTQANRLTQKPESSSVTALSTSEQAEAMTFLKSPKLLDRIAAAFETCGLVGEETNRLAAYLACTSRKLSRPLAVIIQSTSAAGKSTLMEAVLELFPEEECIKYSAMTGQSLYYLGETDLKHKILAIVEEEGAEKASYALKLLQSEGELTIASTGKDPHTGRMETQEYHVEGPVMIFLTTTAIDIDEELQNRCLTLSVDESQAQTQRIHARQRQARTLEGLVARESKKDLMAVLRNAQRLLQPLSVVNDYAQHLTFISERTRSRRDHEKYLTLIDTIALLHQHQREVQTRLVNGREVPFICVTLADIEQANQLAPEVLGRSLDELPPQTRRLLGTIKTFVTEHCKKEAVDQQHVLFSRRKLRELSGWSYSQVKRHLDRLQELEYVGVRYGRMGSTMHYELLIDMNEVDQSMHVGLIDVKHLQEGGYVYDANLDGVNGNLNPPLPNRNGKVKSLVSRV